MKTTYINLERLKRAKPAIQFAENIPDSARLAYECFGNLYPIYINKNTQHILNPVWLAMLAAQDNPPDTVACAVLDLSIEGEKGAAIILNGGIEGLLYNIPEDDIRPYLAACMNEDRAALLAMLPDPEYWHNFFDNTPAGTIPKLAGLPIEELNIPMLDIQHQA